MITEAEALAVLTAMEKAVKERKQQARESVQEDLERNYDATGADRIALKINGEKVGSASLKVTETLEPRVDDAKAFEDFALANGLARIEKRIAPDMMGSAIQALGCVFSKEVMDEVVEIRVVPDEGWRDKVRKMRDEGIEVPGIAFEPVKAARLTVTGCKPEQVVPLALASGNVSALLGVGE